MVVVLGKVLFSDARFVTGQQQRVQDLKGEK